MTQFRMRFPEGRAKALTLSYDDGVEQDIRLIEIMKKNGIKGTFNINSGLYPPKGHKWPKGQIHRRMSLAECQRVYSQEGVEVAIHGTNHPFWDSQPESEAMYDIINDRRALEQQFGTIIKGGAYPYGAFSDDVVDILRLSGIKYCRTVDSTHGFEMPQDWLRLNPTCHHNDERLDELTDEFLNKETDREPMLFYLWGHSYEFERDDNWNVIENALFMFGGRKDVWYATNTEIYDYTHSFRELEFSADAGIVHNPTATDLWVYDGEKTVKIGAGETVKL